MEVSLHDPLIGGSGDRAMDDFARTPPTVPAGKTKKGRKGKSPGGEGEGAQDRDSVGFFELFRFADGVDKALMLVGFALAFANGAILVRALCLRPWLRHVRDLCLFSRLILAEPACLLDHFREAAGRDEPAGAQDGERGAERGPRLRVLLFVLWCRDIRAVVL